VGCTPIIRAANPNDDSKTVTPTIFSLPGFGCLPDGRGEDWCDPAHAPSRHGTSVRGDPASGARIPVAARGLGGV
jgi:hypothetical protein